MLTKSGKLTTSRTAQALTSVTVQHLSGNPTIKRLIEKSVLKRLARFNKQGRRPKLVVKTEGLSKSVTASSTAQTESTSSEPEAMTLKPTKVEPKGGMAAKAPKQLTTKARKLKKNQRKQARILEIILKRSKPNKK